MKPFLYQRLTQALLAEMASGIYLEGNRFLSLRRICRLWDVSEPTARNSIALLVEAGLLQPVSRSGFVLREGFQKHALLLLHTSPGTSLPPPATWPAKRWQLLREISATPQRRIAMILEAPGIDASYADRTDLAALAATRTFFQAAQRDGCDALYFYRDGEKQNEAFILREITPARFDAAAIFRLHPVLQHPSSLDPLLPPQIPVVTVFDNSSQSGGFSVNFHNIGAGYDAARELLKNRPRKLAVLLPVRRAKNAEQRLEGFLLGIKENARAESPEIDILRLPAEETPLDEIRPRLANRALRPDAIFVPGISAFFHLKSRAAAEGWRIPRDIRILGCGVPSLVPQNLKQVDLLHLDFPEAGRRAYQHLRNILDGKPVERIALVAVPPAKSPNPLPPKTPPANPPPRMIP